MVKKVKKFVILIALILLITACSNNPDVFVPEQGDYKSQSDFLKKVDVEIEAVPPPQPIPVVPVTESKPMPAPKKSAPIPVTPPVEQIVSVNTCKILNKVGMLYTPADVQAGKISLNDYNDLRKCYPYFGEMQEDTQAVCCII